MSNYTLELRYISESPFSKVFDFEYDFYEVTRKAEFERKFIEHYFFDEIGFETIDRFKQRLKSKLDMIAPYYKQLYQTELEASKCNFMLNKDLKETFLREIENNNTSTSNMENNTNTTSNGGDVSIGSDTPQGKITDIELYMTNASKSESNMSANTIDSNNASASANHKGIEKTEFLSQGNIGVTSSGALLEDWRKILINIDEMIIKECSELFLMVY